jgi:hypothetical protein
MNANYLVQQLLRLSEKEACLLKRSAARVQALPVPVLTGTHETMLAYAEEHGLLESRTGQNDNTAVREA